MAKPLRVLVVEDSLTVRRHLVDTISSSDEIEVVGEASDGRSAISLCKSLKPDVVTLDLVLPDVDGVKVTEEVMAFSPTPILIVSAATNRADLFDTYDALAAGAVDVLDKPLQGQDREDWKRRFLRAIRTAARVPVITHPRGRLRQTTSASHNHEKRRRPSGHRALFVGASTGGPGAVVSLLRGLPRDFPLPIVIVIHIGESFGSGLAQWLDESSPFPAREARSGDVLPDVGACQVFLAAPGRHLSIEGGKLRLTDGPERHSCRPSVDVLFDSAANDLGAAAIGCLLTGMGRDGAAGLLAIARAGGETFAQDQATSVVFGMPGEAVRLGAARHVLPLPRLPTAIDALVRIETARNRTP